MNKSTGKWWKAALFLLGFILILYVVVFMPIPYMADRPGSADEIKPMILMKEGDQQEKGTFMLTTVSRSYLNVAGWVFAKLDRNAVISSKPKRNEAEYDTQQLLYMTSSQSNAMEAAYRKAKEPYTVEPQYIFVVGLSTNPAPKGNFQTKDKIISIDGQVLKDRDALTALLSGKKPGDKIKIVLDRGGKKVTENAELITLTDASTGKTRAGLGLTIGEVRKVVSQDPGKQVEFASTDIGGPSAGLMFTLEIYNQLTSGDLSQGHRIAGTGTIAPDGTVGAIGGVQFKIVAADRKKAEIFFVPEENYEDAKNKADQIGTSMKLVPVKTVDDALSYLKQLKSAS
ncbi:peptidase S16 [Paenibacillus sp. CAA11]|uniref:SepM family pheromone-processing serine protease n=1 Tax=Paenibacillus sp. CAA11 TaxID=1532905 RepID=UPI000D358C39|nr:SepM family pheromone-processing serine protease [Paenibacillus sp. CAA11]AWB44248.1 peptidase S16 [Paenibacillus sp. CAA11]